MSKVAAISSIPQPVRQRAGELFDQHRHDIFVRTDRLFAFLMAVQWLAGVVIAFWVSPRAWEGAVSRTHVHVHAALWLGLLIVSMPIVLALLSPGAALTRYTIAVAQMLFSSLLIHLTGGRIETHFHVFGSLAFLAVYRDWRVLVAGSIVVGIDHFVRGVFWPQSVYGVLSGVEWRWLEHVAWVAFEDIFLFVAMRQGLVQMRAIAERQALLEAAKESVEAANEAKNGFLAHVSHEIRTPMTAILGYAELLNAPPGGGPGAPQSARERGEYVQTIRRNGEHLLAVVNDILDISKIEAGRLKVERAACCPAAVVEDIVALMRPRAAEKGLPLEAEFRTAIPQTIQTDATRLRQILINLLSNAIKFTAAGEVRVSVEMPQPAQGRDALIAFTVIDTGIGLSQEQQAKLFRPFTQLDDTASRRFGGTGLGLAICKRLCELLGGSVTVESEAGKGSRFTATIRAGDIGGVPLVQPTPGAGRRGTTTTTTATPVGMESVWHSDQPLPTPAAPALSPRANGQAARVTDGCVLLADDSHDNRRLLQRLLNLKGFRVEAVENGRRAVERVLAASNGDSFELVLMDMQMPEMDGYQATAALRAAGFTGRIVALTAHASDADREKCLRAGCDDYMSKPYDVAKLIDLVHAHIRAARDGNSGCGDGDAVRSPLDCPANVTGPGGHVAAAH